MSLLLLSEGRWPPFSGLPGVLKASLIRLIPTSNVAFDLMLVPSTVLLPSVQNAPETA